MNKLKHFSFLMAIFSLVILIGAGCTGKVPTGQPSATTPGATSPSTITLTQNKSSVSIVNFSFQPDNLAVAPGTTIIWTNNDSAPHTITADDGSFNSNTIPSGGTYSHTFTDAGTVAYHCSFHSSMHGSISVAK